MDIVVPTGVGKQVKDIETQEVTIGKRKMEMRWSTNGAFVVVDAPPTATKKKGVLVEIGNSYVIVRGWEQDGADRAFEPPQTFAVGTTEELEGKLAKVVESTLEVVNKYRDSATNEAEATVTDIDSLL